ncbi:hypothetical protein AU490_08415 [Lonsdalea populi]|nr:hypothetical protein AU486_10780 [Lonsdalea quercina]RAT20474.1 hypothetical protein AU487_08135 [Lonsdalea populi]RAT28975.1 hypothetical protein AU490_08415 [Lonsdalea populi]RAT34813.1 hypothetical protein AU491_08650 [Lonsdalea populi]RAT45220.1 hypothetical protein AU496_09820 [Lonsdalea populi]
MTTARRCLTSKNDKQQPHFQRKPPQKRRDDRTSANEQGAAYRKSAFAANVFSDAIFDAQRVTVDASAAGDIFMLSATLRLRLEHARTRAAARSAGDRDHTAAEFITG